MIDDPEVRDDAVEERQDRPEEVVDRVEDRTRGEDHRISLSSAAPTGAVSERTYVRSRDGVESAVVPRVATPHPTHREPACRGRRRGRESASSAYSRARGVEPAARGQVHADQPPRPDRQHQQPGERSGPTAGRPCAATASWRVLGGRLEERGDVLTQRGEGERHDRSFRGERDRRRPGAGAPSARTATAARRRRRAPVALHRGAEPPPDGVGHPRRVVGSVGEEAQRDRAGSLPAGPREGLERRTVADAPDQAERRFRPRARRARSTARPPLVRIRRRKPWVLARLRLLGWYVRFNEEPPRGGRARPGVGDHAGGGNDRVYGSDGSCSQRGAAPDLRVWGKPPRALVAQGCRCYVARLARRRPAEWTSPREPASNT